jgi:hypothetical protein
MVRFNKKESAERRELLASMNQMHDPKDNENGEEETHIDQYLLIINYLHETS